MSSQVHTSVRLSNLPHRPGNQWMREGRGSRRKKKRKREETTGSNHSSTSRFSILNNNQPPGEAICQEHSDGLLLFIYSDAVFVAVIVPLCGLKILSTVVQSVLR